MSSVQIIVGSMLGGTEYVAEACEETLNNLGHQVYLHLQPQFNEILSATFVEKNNKNNIWLLCTSTHGAGEYPDNIQAFVKDLVNCDQDLSSINILTLGIGDTSYDTFCKAAFDINKLLITKGCIELSSIKTFDMSQDIDPEDLAQQWLEEIKDLL